MLISGGLNAGGVLSDAWLLDPQSGRWEEVRMELLRYKLRLLGGVN